MDALKEAVDELYELRDKYFMKHTIEKASEKKKAVADRLAQVLVKVAEVGGNADVAAQPKFLYLKGRAHNVATEASQEAEEALTKVIKLEPNHVAAWNELGENFWKKGDTAQARTCFASALKVESNKESLRSLSMLLRALPGTPLEKMSNIEESLIHAKAALKLDLADGQSWFVLGNAYLALFFSKMETVEHIRQALKAYKKAEEDKVQAANNPDLHQNRATVHQFQEDYALAIEGFQLAALLDPEWPEPKRSLTALQEKLAGIVSQIEAKGRIKAKKLAAYMSELEGMPAVDGTPAQEKYTPIAALEEGVNGGKAARITVVQIVGDETLPRTVLGIDAAGTWVCLTVYNVNADALKVDQMVVIPEPYYRVVKVDKVPIAGGAPGTYEFPSIRVDNPVTLHVNGLPLGEANLFKAEMRIESKSE